MKALGLYPTPAQMAAVASNDWLDEYGWKGWTADPITTFQGNDLTPYAGILFLVTIPIPEPTPISNIHMYVFGAGATLTSGRCFAGLYQDGALLAGTASQHTNWQSTGFKTMALTSPQNVTKGSIQVGYYFNGTTGPSFAIHIGGLTGNINAGLPSGKFRSSYADTGLTTALPSTLAAQTAFPIPAWAAVS